jgi:hypothetical protein
MKPHSIGQDDIFPLPSFTGIVKTVIWVVLHNSISSSAGTEEQKFLVFKWLLSSMFEPKHQTAAGLINYQ